MVYSKTCEYALRALVYLASKGNGVLTMIPEVSQKAHVPAPYLAKVFRCLVRNGVLKSQRGPNGGFAFKRPPETISLFEIVRIIDDVSPLVDHCVMGLDKCSSENACPLHVIWSSTKESIQETLKHTTLTQMRKKIGRFRFRRFIRPRLQMSLGLTDHLHHSGRQR